MTVYIFHKLNTPDDTAIDHLMRQLTEMHVNAELIDADSRRGVDMARLYDVFDRPAVILARSDGSAVERWQGQLPTIEEITYHYSAP